MTGIAYGESEMAKVCLEHEIIQRAIEIGKGWGKVWSRKRDV